MSERAILFGACDAFAQEVSETLRLSGHEIEAGIVLGRLQWSLHGCGVILREDEISDLLREVPAVVCAYSSRGRRDQVSRADGLGLRLLMNVVSPEVLLSPSAQLSHGVILASGANVGPSCLIEEHAAVDRGALISAHARVGPFTVIEPGAVVGRGADIDGDCHVGAGAVVAEGVQIGAGNIIPPGAVVSGNLSPLPPA